MYVYVYIRLFTVCPLRTGGRCDFNYRPIIFKALNQRTRGDIVPFCGLFNSAVVRVPSARQFLITEWRWLRLRASLVCKVCVYSFCFFFFLLVVALRTNCNILQQECWFFSFSPSLSFLFFCFWQAFFCDISVKTPSVRGRGLANEIPSTSRCTVCPKSDTPCSLFFFLINRVIRFSSLLINRHSVTRNFNRFLPWIFGKIVVCCRICDIHLSWTRWTTILRTARSERSWRQRNERIMKCRYCWV